MSKALTEERRETAEIQPDVRVDTAPPGKVGGAELFPAATISRTLSPPVGRSGLRATARVATALGCVALLFLGYEFAFTSLPHDRSQAALLTEFRRDIVTTTLGSPAGVTPEGHPVAVLAIPGIGLSQVVVEGSSPEDLKAGPGHLRATPLPGEFGNAIIAGRRTTYGGPFRNLGRLRRGDSITVSTGQGFFVYGVTDIRRVSPGEADPISGTLDSRLTLLTSDPPFLASGRLVVVAKLLGLPLQLAHRPPVAVGTQDLGLAGDPLGLGLALLWLDLLAVGLWLTRRLWRHWPGPVTLLLATPPLLALLLLAFSGVDRLLPGTL